VLVTFTVHVWCQVIPQAERQLLLLSYFNVNQSKAHVYGQHNYGAEPYVPTGMESLVHNKPQCRRTFIEHYRNEIVLWTSFEHYRGWYMWMVNTRATRISATVFHKHKCISNQTITLADVAVAAAKNLVKVLKGRLPHYL
jgi:hypothetical protein